MKTECINGKAHHWIIEPPNGETSKGVCRNCEAVEEFMNYGRDKKGSWTTIKRHTEHETMPPYMMHRREM